MPLGVLAFGGYNKAVGKVVISDTERFSGYHNEKHKDKETTTTQVNSSLASLGGNVTLSAGNDYKQIASNVIAGNDVNITAQMIDITTAQNTGNKSSQNSDLKIGQFARVMSPIIDLINNIDNARASDGRVKDMQIMAAAANAYQIASAANSGAIFSAEVGTGFAVNRDSSEEQYSQAIASTIKGGGNVNITSTTGDIHAKGANIEAGKVLTLDSARDILLEAGESTQSSNSKNSNYGLEVGTGIAVGAQTGWYFYGQVQAGKGQSNSDGTYYSNSQLVGDSVNLISKGNTTLKGAHAIGNTVTADVGGKLAIESLQDTQVSDSNQSGVSLRVQVAFGTAWSASGSANQAKSEGDYTAVNQQSGLFAGNGGYHVKADSIDLKGGAISSTNAATSELVTNSLTHSDLVNSMSYSASTAGISGGYSFGNGGGEGGDSSTPSGSTNTTSGANPSVTNSGKGASFNASMPMNASGGSSSSTLATLTDGNITIGGVNMSSAKDLGLNTNGAAAHAAIDQIPDLQKILADQQAISTAAGTVIATSAQIASDKVNAADADKKQAAAELESAQKSGDVDAINAAQTNLNQATANAKDVNAHWGTGGDYSRALSAVTSVLVGSVAGQGGTQIAGNALAPYAAQVIGETFDHTDNPNKAAQLLSHAILGATLAYVNGGNVATGAAVGAGSELAAQYLIESLYSDDPQARNPDGSFNPNLLSEEKKQNIVGITSAIGALAGGVGGGGLYNAAVGGNVAANAVVNNQFNDTDLDEVEIHEAGKFIYDKQMAYCEKNPKDPACQKVLNPAIATAVSLSSFGLGTSALVGGGLGVLSNGAAQYGFNGDTNGDGVTNLADLDKTDLAVSFATGAAGVRFNYVGNVVVNQLGYGAQQRLNGEAMTASGSAATFLGTSSGYLVGKYVPKLLNPYVGMTMKQSFDATKPFYSNYAAQKPVFGRVIPQGFKNVPSLTGTFAAPFSQEMTTPLFLQLLKK